MAIALGIMVVAFFVVNLISTYNESTRQGQKAERQDHLNIAIRASNELRAAWSVDVPDSVKIPLQVEYLYYLDSLAYAVEDDGVLVRDTGE